MEFKKIFGYVGAGCLIGIAGTAYLEIGGLAGAFAFGLGLYLIILNKLTLYTGSVGYVKNFNEFGNVLLAFLFNIVGASIVAAIYFLAYDTNKVQIILQTKLELPIEIVIMRAVLCGAMMVCAVESYKRTKNWIGVFISVFVFVACGFEHCIADLFYAAASNSDVFESLEFIFYVFIGNTIGSLAAKQVIGVDDI